MITRQPTSTKKLLLSVSEVYGPVCQGEGILIGRPTVFVRFGGCDYRCSWCDSLYAVLPEYRREWTRMTVEQIAEAVTTCLPTGHTRGHVTLSGGNPAIQPAGPLVNLLHDRGYRVAIETQGSIVPDWLHLIDDLTLSPKPPSSGNPTAYGRGTSLTKAITEGLGANVSLKVVVFDELDYAYAREVHATYPHIPFFVQAGTDVGVDSRDDLCDVLSTLQDRVLADPLMQDVAALPQLHVILKGHGRGI
jgi:7-carboxy-7-deazaguanine synthase